MSSCSSRPKNSLNRGESSSPVEDWQLKILWEWQQKQPSSHTGPNLKQRKLLATQTGLNVKWISSWFKQVNRVSKRKIRAAGKGAFPGTPSVAEATHGPGSPKLEGVAEAILSSSTGVRPRAPEEPFLPRQSDDIGVNTVSECVRSPISPERHRSTGELPDATDPDSDLSKNRDHIVLYSSSHDARLVRVSESPSALLYSQHTVNSCATRLSYDLAPPLQLVSSTGSLFTGSQPPATCSTYTPHSPVLTRYFHATLGGFNSVDPAYPKCTAHDSRSASACIHPDTDSSLPSHVASQPSLVPLPSIYWLLFDRDEHSLGGRDGTLRGSPLSPPGELGGSGVAVASQASATPVSFLARWEDLLTLERKRPLVLCKELVASEASPVPRSDTYRARRPRGISDA